MQVGSVLGDRYQLMASIGRGGMGEVFHALHIESGLNVAVKVVSRAMIGDLLMARLEREAAAASRIHSDYIPRLLDVGSTHEGELFLVMELLSGESLSERIKRAGGVLAWEEVHAMGDNVLRALIDAHAAGVVHRDLKPGNIFLEQLADGSQRAKVLDFGVCKLDMHDAEKLTITGESVGTIAYMAPEQIRGASRVDERADLYSFAMVVFESLSGRLAYDASGQIALLASKLESPARSLKTVAQVPIPAELDGLIARCLSRRPGDRYANAMEMLHAWRALGPPVEPAVLMALPPPSLSGDLNAPTAPTLEVPRPSTLRSSRPAMAVAVGTVILGAAAVFAVVSRHARAGAGALHMPGAVTNIAPAAAAPLAPSDRVSPRPAAAANRGDAMMENTADPANSAPAAPSGSAERGPEVPLRPRPNARHRPPAEPSGAPSASSPGGTEKLKN